MFAFILIQNMTVEDWQNSTDEFKKLAVSGKLPKDVCQIIEFHDDTIEEILQKESQLTWQLSPTTEKCPICNRCDSNHLMDKKHLENVNWDTDWIDLDKEN